jgi:hypothetical protein
VSHAEDSAPREKRDYLQGHQVPGKRDDANPDKKRPAAIESRPFLIFPERLRENTASPTVRAACTRACKRKTKRGVRNSLSRTRLDQEGQEKRDIVSRLETTVSHKSEMPFCGVRTKSHESQGHYMVIGMW